MATPEEILSAIPSDWISNLSFFTNILRAVGVAIGIYILFNVFSLLLNRKKHKEMEKINKNLEEIKKLLTKNSKRK
jgi:signal transduction histidine kinase